MSSEETKLSEPQKNYLKGCEMVVADLENHLKQCNQEFDHYTKMAEYSKTQVDMVTVRFKHEVKSLNLIREEYGIL